MNLYSRYTESLLNRLCSLKTINDKEIYLAPYSIPNSFKGTDGKTVNMYNQGFSVRAEGVKLELAYDKDNTDLPPTERVENATGDMVTSRVKRVNFLLEKALEKMNSSTKKVESKNTPVLEEEDEGSLPF